MKIRGLAAVFNSLSENLGGFREIIKPGAFSETLASKRDVLLLNGHDSGKPLARKSTGSLRLFEDEIGLRFEADLGKFPDAENMVGLVSGRVLINMSFGFFVERAADEFWEEGPDGLLRRTLKRISLIEVSPVAMPAYQATTVTVSGAAVRSKRRPVYDPKAPIGPYRAKEIKQRMIRNIVKADYGLGLDAQCRHGWVT